jgi:hypothetical protein
MKLIAAIVALLAATSIGMAVDAIPPAWLEEMGPGADLTHGEYATLRAVVEDGFTPQTLNSKLYLKSDGVEADIDQTVATSIAGSPVGVTRQLLKQSASASVLQVPSLAIDAEKPAEKTTLVMGMEKDQSAVFSGMIVSVPSKPILRSATDAPFDGLGDNDKVSGVYSDYKGSDDAYGGNHINSWYEFDPTPASFTATFDDTGSLTTVDANDEKVTLKQQLDGAKVVVSAAAAIPYQNGGDIKLSSPCVGEREIWHIAPNGQLTLVADNFDANGKPLDPALPIPTAPDTKAQLTEAAAAVSSNVILEDKEVEILGTVYDIRTMDGNFGLEGAFANAVLTEGSTMNVDLDGDMDFWWE